MLTNMAATATTACAVMMRSGYNNGGLLGVFRCSVFVMNSQSFCWNILIVICDISCSFLTLACVTSVPYRIVSSLERMAIHTVAFVSAIYCSLCIGDIPVCRCIVSALSVRHTFFTMFPSSHHPEIFRSYYQWQMWCPCKRSRSKVKVTEVMTPLSCFRTVTPVWIHILQWNDAQSLVLLRRGALLVFKVIRQISRSHG